MTSSTQPDVMKLQYQVKDNAQDMQDYLRELNNWETDMKSKEQILATNKSNLKPSLPPIRNKQKIAKSDKNIKAQKKAAIPPTSRKKRIASYDYAAWDKLDVDAALEEMDYDRNSDSEQVAAAESAKDASEDSDEDPNMEDIEQRLVIQSDKEKEIGNCYFKNSQYEQAIERYTQALQIQPSNDVTLINRAAALLKIERFAAAEQDCTSALLINQQNAKAYYRRGVARFSIEKYNEAKIDFESFLAIQPNHKPSKEYIKRVTDILHPELKGQFWAVDKPVHLRSTKPMRNILIEDIGSGSETESDKEPDDRKPNNHNNNNNNNNNSNTNSNNNNNNNNNNINDYDRYMLDKLNLLPITNTDSDKPICKQTKPPNLSKTDKLIPNEEIIPDIPKNPQQFMSGYKLLAQDESLFYQYFRNITPSDYPKLFPLFLEGDGLVIILRLLNTYYLPNNLCVYVELQNLAKVSRFNVAIMFLSTPDKEVCQHLFDYLASTNLFKRADVITLANLYHTKLDT